MSKITRRNFLAQATATAAGAATLLGRTGSVKADSCRPKKGTDLVTLGKTGIKSTVLGIGTGTRGGSEQRALGPNGFTRLVRHAYDRGIRYIDTADMYRMHGLVREAIRDLPREKLFIQTKTRAKDAESAKADIDRFLAELNVEYVDTLLMHCMTTRSFPTDMRPVMDVLTKAKEAGKARAIGISLHGMAPLEAAVDCDWIEVQLTRINPFGDKMDGKPEEVAPILKKTHATGRGMLGMKIFGESGYDSPEKRLEALKYVLGLGSIHAFTIGFRTTDQIDETLGMIEKALA